MQTRLKRLLRHEMVGQFVRYGMVGLLNTIGFFTIFNLLKRTLVADVVAFVVISTISFFLNKHWAFRDKRTTGVHRQYMAFFLLTLIGLVIQAVTFRLLLIPLARFGGLGRNAAVAGATPVVVLWNFTAYRKWTFRSPGSPASV